MAFTPISPAGRCRAAGNCFPHPTCRWLGRSSPSGRDILPCRSRKPNTRRALHAEMARLRGWRSSLAVPLMREGRRHWRDQPSRASSRDISPITVELLQTFADQAVIAIENAGCSMKCRRRRATYGGADLSDREQQHPQRDRVLADRNRASSQGHCRKRLRALRRV